MSNFKEIFESLNKIKISIVMQVNLENYENSRKDPIGKFHRAIESFQNQTYKNCELIIVADGCNKTHQLYNRSHKNTPNIKLIYFDRTDTPQMYEEIEDKGKYYRGFGRRLGAAAATGHVVMYMDSDDFLMPNATMTSLLYFNANPEKDWWINTSWFDHESVSTELANGNAIIDPSETPAIQIEGLPEAWKPIEVKPSRQIMAPWLFMHKTTLSTKWRDVISKDTSEDVDFYTRLQSEYPNGIAYKAPVYVRCHLTDKWDV